MALLFFEHEESAAIGMSVTRDYKSRTVVSGTSLVISANKVHIYSPGNTREKAPFVVSRSSLFFLPLFRGKGSLPAIALVTWYGRQH